MSTESSRRWRENNPVKYAYNNLKGSAKRRGLEFTLTFEQFEEFAVRTEYIQNKGKKRDSYTIDRINPLKGYIIENIRILPLSVNSSRKKVLDYCWMTKTAKVIDRRPSEPDEDNPF